MAKRPTLAFCMFLTVAPLLAIPTFYPTPAEARFGVGRFLRVPIRPRLYPRRFLLLPRRTLRLAVGVVTLGVVGAVILSGLPRRHWVAVQGRTNRVVESDPQTEAVDVYDAGNDGTVRITAAPAQPAGNFFDDADLKPTPPPTEETSKKSKKNRNEDDQPATKLGSLPGDTPCRKVTTERNIPGNEKKKQPPETTNHVSLLCKSDGKKWEPAVL